MGIKDLTISLICVGIGILLILVFATDFQAANNSAIRISDDNNTQALRNDIGLNLQNYSGDSQSINDIYYNSTLTAEGNVLYIPSQNTITTTSWKTPFKLFKSSMSYVYVTFFGGRSQDFAYIFAAIISAVSIVGVIYFIKFIRTGFE